ncbi:MAG: PKD domain-containing protein [Hymenobacteraceae bacterium]|nr:PKD domain-containing protein [Hymenobacteraceae bacterium]
MEFSSLVSPRTGILAVLLLLGSARRAHAQASDRDADCPPAPEIPAMLPSSTCIVLDASESVDPLAAALTFRWQMGDGQVREGLQFEYCYAAPGRYIVQLDVVDRLTGEVRRHETERVIDFATQPYRLPDPVLRFTAPATAKAGEPVLFTISEVDLPPCLPATVQFNWNFRDGLLAQGRSVTHVFRRPGTFIVRAAVDGSGIDGGCLPHLCVTHSIIVEP